MAVAYDSAVLKGQGKNVQTQAAAWAAAQGLLVGTSTEPAALGSNVDLWAAHTAYPEERREGRAHP